MKINIIIPYSLDKKFGIEINRQIEMMPDDEWICVMDYDCMFLHYKQIEYMYDYIERYPSTGLFLAMSNRSGSNGQMYNHIISRNDTMLHWLKIAEDMPLTLKYTTPIENRISGFLMLFSKETWKQNKFDENINILDVDRNFAKKILEQGKDIKIMSDILVWHTYRFLNKGKAHLS